MERGAFGGSRTVQKQPAGLCWEADSFLLPNGTLHAVETAGLGIEGSLFSKGDLAGPAEGKSQQRNRKDVWSTEW